MRELQDLAAPEIRRLLCVLLLRLGEVPAGPGAAAMLQSVAQGRDPCFPRLRSRGSSRSSRPLPRSRQWHRSPLRPADTGVCWAHAGTTTTRSCTPSTGLHSGLGVDGFRPGWSALAGHGPAAAPVAVADSSASPCRPECRLGVQRPRPVRPCSMTWKSGPARAGKAAPKVRAPMRMTSGFFMMNSWN